MSEIGHSRIVPFPISITHEQFLRPIFGDRWGEAQVAYFPGNPHPSNPLLNWRVYPAATVLHVMTPDLNNYWNVSLPIAGADGRTNADFAELRAIVLDDVGVKADRSRAVEILGCEPNFVIETSPGSFHTGWIVEPLTDLAWVAGMLRALRAALGADNLEKMMTLVRLPIGTNGKPQYGPSGFRVRLVEWRPGPWIAQAEWPGIETRLGGIIARMPAVTQRLGLKVPDISEVEADPIFRILRDQGRLLDQGHMGSIGWCYNVLCPWAGEGGHDDPSGTAYFPIRRKFTCHHGHCRERTMDDVTAWANEIIKEESGGLLSLPALDFDDVLTGSKQSTSRALASYPAIEDELTRAFVEKHKDALCYDHVRKTWFVWTGGFWAADKTDTAFDLALSLLRDYRGGLQDATQGLLRTIGKVAFARSIETAARADRQLASDGRDWDQDPWLAGAPGCEIDLRTGAILPPDPGHKITRQLSVAPRDMPTPLWDQFIWDTTRGDPEAVEFLHVWTGYCLTGDTSEEKFVFLCGPGGNGKGTFLSTLGAIMNDYAARAPGSMFMIRRHEAHPEEIARLAGIRLVTAAETEKGQTFNATRLKDFTGRDGKLVGAFKFRDSFEFMPLFKIMVVGNNQPRLDVDDAIRRRTIVLYLDHKPAVPDITLKDRLVAEHPGILHKMIEGELLRREKGGLVTLIPGAAIAATSEYLDEQDTLKTWTSERCKLGPDEKMGVTEALDDYRLWCHVRGEQTEFGIRDFSSKFTERFPSCSVKKTMGRNTIKGASLLPT